MRQKTKLKTEKSDIHRSLYSFTSVSIEVVGDRDPFVDLKLVSHVLVGLHHEAS